MSQEQFEKYYSDRFRDHGRKYPTGTLAWYEDFVKNENKLFEDIFGQGLEYNPFTGEANLYESEL